MIKNSVKTNNLISSKYTILIYNILRELGFIPTLKGTKLLNKAIQIVINSGNEFIVIEDIYNQIALNYEGFNSMQILKKFLDINMIDIILQIKLS